MQERIRLLGLMGIISLAACVTVVGQTTSKDARSSEAYISEADVYFQQHDFKSAIPLYRKALDLQKKKPTIDKTHWRLLVDSLGQSYGISGDLKNAKATYTYGLKNDPTYWAFHYNMACTYAEMDDVDNAILHLRKAFEKRDKTIKYPDPWTDGSFQRLIGNEKFVNALREIHIN